MRVFRSLVFFLVVALPFSAHAASKNTAREAIKLADKACDASWGAQSRKNGSEWHIDPEKWHARIVKDHWKVWVGAEGNPNLSINIPIHGSRVDSDSCDLRFQE